MKATGREDPSRVAGKLVLLTEFWSAGALAILHQEEELIDH